MSATAAVRATLLWIRGAIFTALVPLVVAGWAPRAIDPFRRPAGGAWNGGWLLVAAGTAIYLACLLRFLAAGGTPAIFFTRPLRGILGEEPPQLVQSWLYTFTRNPMYVGVVLAIFGQAIVFASRAIAIYGAAAWLTFHLVVTLLEEPHLHGLYGAAYEEYCRRVPRWLLLRRRNRRHGVTGNHGRRSGSEARARRRRPQAGADRPPARRAADATPSQRPAVDIEAIVEHERNRWP